MNGDVVLADGVVMNPGISGGLPCVVGHRIRTDILLGRFIGGEGLQVLVDDYGITLKAVETALRYEFILRKRRQKRPQAR
jgi:uncharacterized protein (DUF433 family)